MSDSSDPETVSDPGFDPTTLALLHEMLRLAADPVAPSRGVSRLRRRALEVGGPQVSVLWERDGVHDAIRYDALIRRPGLGTVSLGFSPDAGAPWALRGTFRWSELDMLRVNSRRVRVDEVVGRLDMLWSKPVLRQRLIDAALIWEALEADPDVYAPSDAELQAGMDAFRTRHRLRTAQATIEWLEARGMTHRSFEQSVAGQVRVHKLREQIIAGGEDAYLLERRHELDLVVLARLTMPFESDATALYRRLQAGELDVLAAACGLLRGRATGDDPWTPPAAALAGVHRWELPQEQAAVIFAAEVGTVLPPTYSDGHWDVAKILGFEIAESNAVGRTWARRRMFERWLADARVKADVEWLWGNNDQD